MGIYDRDYNRGDYDGRQGGFAVTGPTTWTVRIIILMCLVFLVQLFDESGRFTAIFSCYPDVFQRPSHLFQLLTYGFLHDPHNWMHIAFNMYGLWLFGRDVEYRYGKREFLAFFLVSIVAGGIAWVLGEFAANGTFLLGPALLGASGGVTAIVILYALNFPDRPMVLLFAPMPMWVVACIYVGMDLLGAINRTDHVAFTAHLGGALFAFLYYKSGIRLESLLFFTRWRNLFKPRPKLRVVDAEEDEDASDDTEAQVDEILKKIQEHGRDSLTRSERRILEAASREYQKRRGQ